MGGVSVVGPLPRLRPTDSHLAPRTLHTGSPPSGRYGHDKARPWHGRFLRCQVIHGDAWTVSLHSLFLITHIEP